MYSLIIPVYKNEQSIPSLLEVLQKLNISLQHQLEVVFVVDGSPDQSYFLLKQGLKDATFKAKLIALSRNFGAFAAIRAGLEYAEGKFFAVIAADLQEPPELVVEFFIALEKESVDVVIAARDGRADPFFSRLASKLFWACYRKFIVSDMPPGGVDVFACNLNFRNQLLKLEESHSSLIALIFWLGFKRKQVNYQRLARAHGKSAWTFRKKFRYMMDSVFAFTDLPIRILMLFGVLGIFLSSILGIIVLIGKFMGWFVVPGYATTLLVVLFLGTLNILGLGLVGSYAWRAYENTKRRPLTVVMSVETLGVA